MMIRAALCALLLATVAPDRVGSVGRIPEGSGDEEKVRIAIVVNRKSPLESLGIEEARRIFLRKKLKAKDVVLQVYRQKTGNPIRTQFSVAVLGKRPAELKEYWLNLKLTRGLREPRTLRSSKLVKLYVSRVRGGVGYIYADEVDETVRVLRIVEVSTDES